MQTKTSLTHPLKIDAMPCGGGLLGMTLCPGKQAESYFGGQWERDLALDMGVIVDWGASTLVSLMEDHEFPKFGVPDLGDIAEAAGLEWHWLPIRDVHAPDERFERLWTYSGHILRRKLASGERIVLHCRGGLGRTGTIAARLAIECGVAHRRKHCSVYEKPDRGRWSPVRNPTSCASRPFRRTTATTPTGFSAACWAARSAMPSDTR